MSNRSWGHSVSQVFDINRNKKLKMGHGMSDLHDDLVSEPLIGNYEERAIYQTDFKTWKESGAAMFGFPPPCVEFHMNQLVPYTLQKCFILEITGTRRRTVQFRRELTHFSAELEQVDSGDHCVHIRNLVTGQVSIVTLLQASQNLPELDYIIDPILTVISYHGDVVVVSVQDKTKNIPKLILFCDIKDKREVGHFSTPVNYNNLSGVSVTCIASVDGTNFLLFVVEDHYDEFHVNLYALQFSDTKPVLRCSPRSDQSSWYEPNLHLSYLGSSNDHLLVLGDCQFGISPADSCRYLLLYDLKHDKVLRFVSLKDSLYPVCLTCSPDATWIATLSRDPAAWDGDAEGYVVRLYTAESLTLTMEIKVPLAVDNYNTLSNCSKIMFSRNSTLMAITSSDTRDEFGPDFYGYCGGFSKKGTSGVVVTVYRLPVVDMSLKALCRDVIMANCSHGHIYDLPLPNSIKAYLSCVDTSSHPSSESLETVDLTSLR